MKPILKTAEAVSPAHPDKVCDQISDCVLTKALAQDPKSRVAIEAMIGHHHVFLTGEMTTKAEIDIDACVREVLELNRYEDPWDYTITHKIVKQSHYIAAGVDKGGAGDQGIMVGFACRDNEHFIPHELFLARQILQHLWKNNKRARDAKSQITLDQENNVVKVVVSAERLQNSEIQEAVEKVIGKGEYDLIINPAGYWDGGPDADAGCTGRKIVQDAFGPGVEVGGGAFSGKDPTKVDRSAAYFARYTALKMLHDPANKHCSWIKVKVAYALGVVDPLMITVESDKNEPIDATEDLKHIFRPADMARQLRKVNYLDVARWGSYGNPNFPWEKL